MKINDFGLSEYRKTKGREGEGFTAILTYHGKAVATFENYATGALPKITFNESSHGKEELLSMMAYIDAALHPHYLKLDDVESCTISLCEMLDEGRDIDQMFRSVKKDSASYQHALIILSGHSWMMAPEFDGYSEISQLIGVPIGNITVKDSQTAIQKAHRKIREIQKKGDFKYCTGFLVLDMQRPTPLVLTTTEYIEIFSGAAIFDKQDELVD